MTGVTVGIDDAFGNASMRGPSITVEPGSTRAGQSSTFQKNVQELLGGKIQLGGTLSGGLDLHEGYPHSSTGLVQAIHGSATQVQVDVADALVGYNDPIKSILGVGVHKDQKILIRRKYVVGGQATITPERAPARTVAVQEDVREVMLTRYGGACRGRQAGLRVTHQYSLPVLLHR